MRVLFVGLGSIGQRHLRVLKEICDIDAVAYKTGLGELSFQSQVTCFSNFDKAIETRPDFAIISNPTSLHMEVALALANEAIPFFIEKPVSHELANTELLLELVRKKNIPSMVGFQMRHHPAYQKMAAAVKEGTIGRPIHFHGSVGQYLPTWRPNTDYRKCYSSKSDYGGGVVFDLCHELDIAVSILGKVDSLFCMCGKFSELEIDTEDLADISIKHANGGQSHIHLNYLNPGYQWHSHIIGTRGAVFWDYGNKFIKIRDHRGNKTHWDDPVDLDRDWLFRTQMRHWLEVLKGNCMPTVSLEEGINITKLCIEAKRSSNHGKQIFL